jgi:glycosyltransferase involved in cell wall biosynthesis
MDTPARSVKMRVLLHALKLHEGSHNKLAGNYYHVRYLAGALLERPEVELQILADEFSGPALRKVLPEDRLLQISLQGLGVARADWKVVQLVHRLRPDVYHRPTGQLPFIKLPVATVASIADLNFRALPTGLVKRVYKELSYRWTLRVADWVTCVSEFTKAEVIKAFRADPGRLTVVHHGTNKMAEPDFDLATTIGVPFWLAFGHQANKNMELVLRALRHMRDHALPCPTVVIVGQSDHLDSVIAPLCHQLGVADLVRFVGKISDGQLSGLYRKSEGLLFVSRYEGFGLPILEAMSFGVPVICSRAASIPEVAGNAALYLDSGTPECLALAMSQIQNQAELRDRLGRLGHIRAAHFSWERAAAATVDVYQRAIQFHGSR